MILLGAAFAGTLGLSHGEQPLDEPWVSVRECSSCHLRQAADWSTSRHASAHTNPLYRVGLSVEPSAFCVNCHSPLRAQVAEVDPLQLDAPTPRADEGVTCAVCHVREGDVISAAGAGYPGHGDRAEPIDSPDFCAGCHEFPMPHFVPGGWEATDVPMQSTASEHRRWDGPESCVDCHMPQGRHVFRGAYDLPFLRGALHTEVVEGSLRLRSVGVGHAFPTGDLFRHLTVEVHDGDAWQVVARLGRSFGTVIDPQTFVAQKRLLADTSLQPGEVRSVPVGDRPWRVVYHYGSAKDEQRGLPDEVLYALLAAGGPLKAAAGR